MLYNFRFYLCVSVCQSCLLITTYSLSLYMSRIWMVSFVENDCWTFRIFMCVCVCVCEYCFLSWGGLEWGGWNFSTTLDRSSTHSKYFWLHVNNAYLNLIRFPLSFLTFAKFPISTSHFLLISLSHTIRTLLFSL